MRRLAAILSLGAGCLLLTAAASGLPYVPGDPTPPVVSPVITGTLGDSGWYTTNVTVNWSVTDPESIILNTTGCNTITLTGDTTGRQLTCSAESDGGTTTVSKTFKVDKTAPATTATPSRGADANGWYNRSLTVGFTGTDGTSGLSSCSSPRDYGGPDSATASVSGTCRDQAGNTASVTLSLKYDATSPTASASARAPDANGWFNHAVTVTFQGSDSTSGVDTCTQVTYAGPDNPAVAFAGTCRDRAGNVSGSSGYSLKYDGTPPAVTAVASRAPDAGGWYNHQLTVSLAGSDATSGLASCDAPKSYAGPDTAAVLLGGVCRDQAGNQSAPAQLHVKYDGTAPLVSDAIPVRAPDRAGWYNRPVSFAVQGTDAFSGVGSCPAISYGGPDGAGASVAAACVDNAGNRSVRAFPLRYDATGPSSAATPDREPNANGWYNRALTVSFTGTDAVSGLESCAGPVRYDGPDNARVSLAGACFDKAGNAAPVSSTFGYDATAPDVTGAFPSRAPDGNGWYKRPVAIGFRGSDATSQIDACTQVTYAGPDTPGTTVNGSCRDRAGNGSPSMSFALRFDSIAPTLGNVRTKAGNGTVELSWSASPDTTRVEVRRADAVVYSGTATRFVDRRLRNGHLYRYSITAYDQAANTDRDEVSTRPNGPLLAPLAGAVVSYPPRLAWKPVEKATYYNVQVWRDRKVLSAWPRGSSLRLKRLWTYDGRQYRLKKGRYRWYVWPGFGRREEKRFGRLVGSSAFVVR